MQKIIFIHGANCSPVIWNYLAPKIKGKREFIAYDTSAPFERNLEDMKQNLSMFKDAVIVAHSMGGLYAAHLVHIVGQYGVKGVVSISTPFNGSEKASQLAILFPDYQMLHDIGSNAKPVKRSQEVLANIYVPWVQLVSVKGHVPLISKPNDGVVSIESQKYIKNMNCVELPYNHFEILLNEETVTVVNEFIAGLN